MVRRIRYLLGGCCQRHILSLAAEAGSEAVLPAYIAGLVIAGIFLHDRVLIDRMRSICFALLTPFFFLRPGTLISAPALASGAGVIVLLLGVKLAAKGIGVWPTAAEPAQGGCRASGVTFQGTAT